MSFPLINPYQQFFDSSGAPLESGTVEFQDPATSDKIDTFPTADDADAGTNANANPLTLNASGASATGIYLRDGIKYKVIVKDVDGNTVTNQDDVRCPQYTAPKSTFTVPREELTLKTYAPTLEIGTQAYTRNATVVEDRTLLASASATTLNNNNVLAALIADLQAKNII